MTGFRMPQFSMYEGMTAADAPVTRDLALAPRL
jgi:hypothetical protein